MTGKGRVRKEMEEEKEKKGSRRGKGKNKTVFDKIRKKEMEEWINRKHGFRGSYRPVGYKASSW